MYVVVVVVAAMFPWHAQQRQIRSAVHRGMCSSLPCRTVAPPSPANRERKMCESNDWWKYYGFAVKFQLVQGSTLAVALWPGATRLCHRTTTFLGNGTMS